jgi:hypothetical protein
MTMRDNARTTKFHPGAEQPRPVSGSNPPRRRGRSPLWTRLTMLGPAFVAAVAYVGPGNVATNLQAGARYGCCLCGFWSWPPRQPESFSSFPPNSV